MLQRLDGLVTTRETTKRYGIVDLLKIALTIGIVFRHAELVGEAGILPEYDTFNRAMMLLTELCVPMCFILSGFLYFRNVPERPDWQFFWKKTRSRCFSLLIPYLIANCVAFLCYWAAYRYVPEMMSGWFGDDWRNPLFVFWSGPVNLSLWFIRDLIIACLFAPLTWLIVRYTRFYGVLALGLVWFFRGMAPWYNFFFALGAWAAIRKVDVVTACRRSGPVWLLVYLCCFYAAMKDYTLTNLTILAGIPFSICAADAAMQTPGRTIDPAWQGWCFFIYLYHYILILVVKKVLPMWMAPNKFMALLLCYLAVALLTLGLLSGLYLIMKRLMPRVTGVLVGGKV